MSSPDQNELQIAGMMGNADIEAIAEVFLAVAKNVEKTSCAKAKATRSMTIPTIPTITNAGCWWL